ncbi:uncharacterized protein LOC111249807 isoform X3 [Varroa destructor]|uniref:K Homology domain-containing protein n=1 Tax=Varroa destructor TaxID=109461 RepID=A0A7M7MGD6_VARDE|nr:uncharacterized protein LOC111249807 isoform X3 [Varroa destructor]
MSDDTQMEIVRQLGSSQMVEQLVTIPRKFYDRFIANPPMIRELTKLCGTQIEILYQDFDRQYQTVSNCFTDCQTQPVQQTPQRQPKSRREYLLRIVGSQQHVSNACQEIFKILNYNVNGAEQMTLKLDVSFAVHSFIIGRDGKGSKTVMRATGTLVHFPDSNRNSKMKKSNQVSVSGSPEQVLKARRMLRDRLPISFMFLLEKADYIKVVGHCGGNEQKILAKLRKRFEALQNEYSMSISYQILSNGCIMVTVRGARNNFEGIREGLTRLMEILRPNRQLPPVSSGIEVSLHYLSFVLGRNDVKVRYLMALTNTQFQVITNREDRQYHIPTIRIYGQIDDVFKAWMHVLDLLPATTLVEMPRPSQEDIADLREVTQRVSSLNQMLEDYDITLNLKLNRDSRQWKIAVHGPEKYLTLLVDVYRALGRLDVNSIHFVQEAITKTGPPLRYHDAIRSLDKHRLLVETSQRSHHLPTHKSEPEIGDDFDTATISRSTYFTRHCPTSQPIYHYHGLNTGVTNQPKSIYADYRDQRILAEQSLAYGGYQIYDQTPRSAQSASSNYPSDASGLYDSLASLASLGSLASHPSLENVNAVEEVPESGFVTPMTFRDLPRVEAVSTTSIRTPSVNRSSFVSTSLATPASSQANYLSGFKGSGVAASTFPSTPKSLADLNETEGTAGRYGSVANFTSLGSCGSSENLGPAQANHGYGSISSSAIETPTCVQRPPANRNSQLPASSAATFGQSEFIRQKEVFSSFQLSPTVAMKDDEDDFIVRGPFGVLRRDDQQGSAARDYFAGDKWTVANYGSVMSVVGRRGI